MKGKDKLKQSLLDIAFLPRFKSLRDNYCDLDSAMEDAHPTRIKEIIESFGYDAKYNKGHNFFKIIDNKNDKSSLNLSTKYGKSEFILNVLVDEIPCGDTFSLLSITAGSSERVKNPFFKNYDEFRVILSEVLSIWEDIKESVYDQT